MQAQTRIKHFRQAAGFTQQDLRRWEQEASEIRNAQRLVPIADALNCSVDDLLGRFANPLPRGVKPVPSDTYAPVYGYVPAGDPYEATEIDDEEHWVDPDVRNAHPDGFFLIVKGDSMDKLFPDGAYVYIDPKAIPHDRDVVAILVNGDDATIKRVFFAGDVIVLHPDSSSPRHKARTIDVNDSDAPPVRILGKAVWHTVPIGHGY